MVRVNEGERVWDVTEMTLLEMVSACACACTCACLHKKNHPTLDHFFPLCVQWFFLGVVMGLIFGAPTRKFFWWCWTKFRFLLRAWRGKLPQGSVDIEDDLHPVDPPCSKTPWQAPCCRDRRQTPPTAAD